jgi:hypothetical protein
MVAGLHRLEACFRAQRTTEPYNDKQNGETTGSCEHLELDDDQQVATRVEIKKN